MNCWQIDLYSDTKTRPSPEMRAIMAEALVGDEQQDEDPTVSILNERIARFLGKEQAVFLPSGTMANLVSILVHCSRGDEILCEATSHVLHYETGGPAAIAGATVTPLLGSRGMFAPKTLEEVLRTPYRNSPRPRLIWVEQTTNLGGGAVWPLHNLQALRRIAEDKGLAFHIDGARLMNAVVAQGVEAHVYGEIADSLWIDFSKGLGAPFGAVLAGSQVFIDQARRYKHMLGGAMRQAGIMAAACLYALDNNVKNLAVDHANARSLADGIKSIAGIEVVEPVDTNIVVCDVKGTGYLARDIANLLAVNGIRVGVFGPSIIRLVTHCEVSRQQIELVVKAMEFSVRDS